jgi:hypothetical protein
MKLTIQKKIAGTEDHYLASGEVQKDGAPVAVKNAVIKQTGNKAELVVKSDVPTLFGSETVKQYKTNTGAPVETELASEEPLKKGSEVEFHNFTIVHTNTKS